MPMGEQRIIDHDYGFWARGSQLEPEGDWATWLLCAGRGAGKTWTGAKATHYRVAHGLWKRIALVAATAADARDVMVEGESGILATAAPGMRPMYEPSKRRLTWPNGAIATLYSAEEPDRLRGPQHDGAWCDEVSSWERPDTYDMLNFGLRLGDRPQRIVTTTPKANVLTRRIYYGTDTVVSGGSTFDNSAWLAPSFLKEIARYDGTPLGDQELYAKLVDLSEVAILPRAWWQVYSGLPGSERLAGNLGRRDPRIPSPMEFEAIILSVDTGYKDNADNDDTAFTKWGIFRPWADGYRRGRPCMLLLKAWREKLRFPALRDRIKGEIQQCEDEREGTPPDHIIIEDKGSGISLIQELQYAGVDVFAYNPGSTSKLMRAHEASDVLHSGAVWVIGRRLAEGGRSDTETIRWADDVLSQCEEFTGAKDGTDDYVDSCVQAWAFARDNGLITIPADEPTDEERDERPAKPAPREPIYG